MTQYQVQHHAMGVIGVGVSVGDPSNTYHTGGLTHYAHPAAYYTHHSASTPHSAPGVDPSSAGLSVSSAVDNDYFAMAANSSFHQITPPTQIHQNLGASTDAISRNSASNNDNSAAIITSGAHIDTAPSATDNSVSTGSSKTNFECILEAQTSPSQKSDSHAHLAHLNKGQTYNISIIDRSHSCTSYISTLRIAFHDGQNRQTASRNWSFWLSQQDNPDSACAMELDTEGSVGVENSENKQMDRVSFRWHGQRGAKVAIRFNCLSTDFSKLKGVKGFTLRLHMDTFHAQPSHADGGSGSSVPPALSVSMCQFPSSMAPTKHTEASAMAISPVENGGAIAHQLQGYMSTPVSPTRNELFDPQYQQIHNAAAAGFAPVPSQQPVAMVLGELIERCYTCIKLFRDKGAERKNKDELKQLENTWVRQMGKLKHSGLSEADLEKKHREFKIAYIPVQPYSRFVEYIETDSEPDPAEQPTTGDTTDPPTESAPEFSPINLSVSGLGLTDIGSSVGSDSAACSRKRSLDDGYMLPTNKRQISSQVVVGGPDGAEILGIDPSYVPVQRKKSIALVAYVRPRGERFYRAIYLERFAVAEFASKIAQTLELQTPGDVELIHKMETGQAVRLTDIDIKMLDNQRYIDVECIFDEETGTQAIHLHYE
ncbi:hypothetical protein EV175_001162 [Coemansia sp. RSA 1933]|nr:hypothetical protein EV175_001162 [Coemansia sp. RSA 1933]